MEMRDRLDALRQSGNTIEPSQLTDLLVSQGGFVNLRLTGHDGRYSDRPQSNVVISERGRLGQDVAANSRVFINEADSFIPQTGGTRDEPVSFAEALPLTLNDGRTIRLPVNDELYPERGLVLNQHGAMIGLGQEKIDLVELRQLLGKAQERESIPDNNNLLNESGVDPEVEKIADLLKGFSETVQGSQEEQQLLEKARIDRNGENLPKQYFDVKVIEAIYSGIETDEFQKKFGLQLNDDVIEYFNYPENKERFTQQILEAKKQNVNESSIEHADDAISRQENDNDLSDDIRAKLRRGAYIQKFSFESDNCIAVTKDRTEAFLLEVDPESKKITKCTAIDVIDGLKKQFDHAAIIEGLQSRHLVMDPNLTLPEKSPFYKYNNEMREFFESNGLSYSIDKNFKITLGRHIRKEDTITEKYPEGQGSFHQYVEIHNEFTDKDYMYTNACGHSLTLSCTRSESLAQAIVDEQTKRNSKIDLQKQTPAEKAQDAINQAKRFLSGIYDKSYRMEGGLYDSALKHAERLGDKYKNSKPILSEKISENRENLAERLRTFVEPLKQTVNRYMNMVNKPETHTLNNGNGR